MADDPVPAARASKTIGVLLINLGTPEATDFWSVRRYLKEFLSDRRVVETPRILWWPILNFVILTVRPARSGKAYRSIWDTEKNESPLTTITRAQGEKLAAFAAAGGFRTAANIHVEWAMRYGKPSIARGLAQLREKGCDRLLIMPLYPQYAAATTATAGDAVFAVLAKQRFQPAIRMAAPYFDSPAYIDAVAASIEKFLAGLGFSPDVILASFHGIPQEFAEKGDPYPAHCQLTVNLLRKRLGRTEETLRVSYQSRFGPAEWLRPYTDATVIGLARQGVKNLVLVMPGFSADCLETLQEIGIENRHFFLENGGRNFAVAPCLNDSPEGMQLLETLVEGELAGWL